MGKSNRAKKEFLDVQEMVFLLQTLKDIADNKFFTLVAERDKFRRFGESFVEFFRLISLTKEEHPLIRNDNPTVGIVIVTAEGAFLGDFNNKLIRKANQIYEKSEKARFIGIGDKSEEPLKRIDSESKIFTGVGPENAYKLAIDVKDYLLKEIEEGRLGKVVVVFTWLKNTETTVQRTLDLLPCADLVKKQADFVDEFENIIEESQTKDMITSLVDLWITTRLYSIIMDTILASALAQSKFLDDSLEKMKKELNKEKIKYRKAKKADIDTSLRETFSAKMMAEK